MQFRESVHKWDFHLVPIRRFTASVTGLGGDFTFFSIIPFGRRVPEKLLPKIANEKLNCSAYSKQTP